MSVWEVLRAANFSPLFTCLRVLFRGILEVVFQFSSRNRALFRDMYQQPAPKTEMSTNGVLLLTCFRSCFRSSQTDSKSDDKNKRLQDCVFCK